LHPAKETRHKQNAWKTKCPHPFATHQSRYEKYFRVIVMTEIKSKNKKKVILIGRIQKSHLEINGTSNTIK